MIAKIVTAIVFIMSIILLTGKGSWLIAGYNSMSKEQQEKFDKRKLSRVAGVMLLIVTIATLALEFLHIRPFVFSLIIFTSIILTFIYMNRYCRKPVSEKETIDIKYKNGIRQEDIVAIIGMGFVFILLILVGISVNSSSKTPVYSINEGTLIIDTGFGEKVNFNDIQSVQIKNNLPDIQAKIYGAGPGLIVKGKYTTDIGNVTLYVDTRVPPFIYIHTTSGLIILNDESKEKTEVLFEKLNSEIKP